MWPFKVQQIPKNKRGERRECLRAAFTRMDLNYTWFGLNIESAKKIRFIFSKSWRLSFALTCHLSDLLWGDYECVCACVCGRESLCACAWLLRSEKYTWTGDAGEYSIWLILNPLPSMQLLKALSSRGQSDGTLALWCTQPWLSPMIQLGPLVNTMKSRCVSE